MPSQEDYLDELLKTMDEDTEKEEAEKEEAPEDGQEIPSIDTLSELTDDEIMQLLAESGGIAQDAETAESEGFVQDAGIPQNVENGGKDADIADILESIEADASVTENAGAAACDDNAILSQQPDFELFSELDSTEDEDLQEIRELLQKADRNEPIAGEEDQKELSEGLPEELSGLFAESASIFEKEAEKPEAKAEKSEAARREKAEKREAARKERAEKREAGRKERAEKRKTARKERAEKREAAKTTRAEKRERQRAERKAAEREVDVSSLDAIVAEAGGLGVTDGLSGPDEPGNADSLSGLDGLGDADGLSGLDGLDREGNLDETEEAENEDAFNTDFDLDNLFQTEENSELFSLMDDGTDAVEAVIEGTTDTRKGKGLFRKIVEFLTEEEEEEENEEIRLSDENRGILKDLDKEGKTKKRRKKSKKSSKQGGEEEEGSLKATKKAKTKKAGKENKPKREKKVRREKEIGGEGLTLLVPGSRLSFKRILPILLSGASLGVLLFVFANAAADYTDKREAREAFYDGDYRTCYQNLYGKELNESEKVMYAKSESILYIRLWLREYEMFADEGDEMRALDSLIQTVDDYPVLYAYAVQWNADAEVEEGYAQILGILLAKYGLTQEQAQQIADEPKDKEYTRMVAAVVQGKGLQTFGKSDAEDGIFVEGSDFGEAGSLADELPEEMELGQGIFIESR